MDQVYGVPVIYEGSGARVPFFPPHRAPLPACWVLPDWAPAALLLNLAPAAYPGAFFLLAPPRVPFVRHLTFQSILFGRLGSIGLLMRYLCAGGFFLVPVAAPAFPPAGRCRLRREVPNTPRP
jgi:hypothetical protein